MLTLQDRGCQNINLVTSVELSQDRQQHTVAVLGPARRRLLDISWSFSADETGEVRELFDYFTQPAPALMATVDKLQGRPTSARSADGSRPPAKSSDAPSNPPPTSAQNQRPARPKSIIRPA